MKVGLIAMSGKPVHAGHYRLIEIAAKENDEVLVFVSTSDRKRPGELIIKGDDMLKIWKLYIEPSLPNNVTVEYGGSPIRKVWETLGEANEEGSDDTYVIYSDPEDMQNNFPPGSFEKYAPDLYNRRQIVLEPIHRSSTINISGTKMRSFLVKGEMEEFIDHLPKPVQGHGREIWNILSSGAMASKRRQR